MRSTNEIVLACWNFVLVVVTVIVSDCAVLDFNIFPIPHQCLIGIAYPTPKNSTTMLVRAPKWRSIVSKTPPGCSLSASRSLALRN